MDESDVVWVFVAATWLVGAYLIVFARRVTERDQRRSAAAREKYAHRPAIWRPKIANQRPNVLRTRLTGVGFIVIGLLAVVLR